MTLPIVSWIRAALLRAAGRDRNGNPHQPPADSIPLRAELFSGEQLQRYARTLADQHRLDPRRGRNRLLARLAENEQVLVQTYDLVTAAEARGLRVAPAGEWLLDNYYLVEQQIRMAKLHLPRTYSRELPRLSTGPLAGFPRVYDIALELIAHVDGRVDAENLGGFVAAYQSVTPLTLGELWAVPIMLRLALIENLRRVAAGIARRRTHQDLAKQGGRSTFIASVLTNPVGKRVRDLLRLICTSLEVEIKQGHISRDHIHMLVSVPPYVSVSKLVQRMKGLTSRRLLQENRGLNKMFWGRHLWARGYFVASTGNVTEEVIGRYIADQGNVERDQDADFKVEQ